MLKYLLSNTNKYVKLTEEILKNVKNYDDFITKVGDNMYKINDGKWVYYTNESGVNTIISMMRSIIEDKLQKFQSKHNEIRTNIETNTLLLSKQD